MYYVEGGEYKNTAFIELVSEKERYGPFNTYDEAYDVWQGKSWFNVDDCHARYQIMEE